MINLNDAQITCIEYQEALGNGREVSKRATSAEKPRNFFAHPVYEVDLAAVAVQ